ncbi:MAG: SIR2 family protein [Alphaproteobacteria bacterium]|nr:SIR2 family protein [Alphaproteobacteria bacterium]
MSKEAIARLRDAAAAGNLVVVLGTGVSLALTKSAAKTLSWRGLVEHGFDYGARKGRISSEQHNLWRGQVRSDDIDDLLGAAEFVSRKLQAPDGQLYGRWLEEAFTGIAIETDCGMANALRALKSHDVPICTLNYDTLTEDVTSQDALDIGHTEKVIEWLRRERQSILHLHGVWNKPSSCILGIRDYESARSDEVRNLIQRALGTLNLLLFVGCGGTFSDPNFAALTTWMAQNLGVAAPQHYALVTQAELAMRESDAAWHGFVSPVSCGDSLSDIPAFLLDAFPTRGRARKANKRSSRAPAASESRALAAYRSFLVRDCGQMTIEGMRADWETAQRRFDIERLFVPLNLTPSRPSSDESEPKVAARSKITERPVTFGTAFSKAKKLALLALPGGGKSLLLKRLAVAYALPERRLKSKDDLPELELTPLLIRCRDWREEIRRPILAIIDKIGTFTGQPELAGLRDAFIPLLQDGKVLLLFDGLDEFHGDADRATFADNLESFLEAYPKIHVVVTSREAGFDLVAPCLARFCDRWRIAPLGSSAIELLTEHWHQLMSGGAPEAEAEAKQVAKAILSSPSLRHLAENPLLLTMLLVVKHGAGKLPPDRVSLYRRAVEVLLDTWNIKGHDALNLKEAVPQLACVAFELTSSGRQTATEKELLHILENAREKLPQIRRYAQGSPHDFLKRVELRSSLLMEAGRKLEAGSAVPFYQFRHLTFQEYLAAVAIADGQHLGYDLNETVLQPVEQTLLDAKWKEVIPMAAVLAGKQAEPLLAALVTIGKEQREKVLASGPAKDAYVRWPLPEAIDRLVQCLAEEAEATQETLLEILSLTAFFAGYSYIDPGRWSLLARGPYANELFHNVWQHYRSAPDTDYARFRFSLGRLAADLLPQHWQSPEGEEHLRKILASELEEDVAKGLCVCVGHHFSENQGFELTLRDKLWPLVEQQFLTGQERMWPLAVWAWALMGRGEPQRFTSATALDKLLALCQPTPRVMIARLSHLHFRQELVCRVTFGSPSLMVCI